MAEAIATALMGTHFELGEYDTPGIRELRGEIIEVVGEVNLRSRRTEISMMMLLRLKGESDNLVTLMESELVLARAPTPTVAEVGQRALPSALSGRASPTAPSLA